MRRSPKFRIEVFFLDRETLESLKTKIRYHEYQYYVLDNPQISDYEFDQLINVHKFLLLL